MTLHLFQGFGIELEYMIVSRETLAAMPICDELLMDAGGQYGDFENGDADWSNELVLHVLEIKTAGPAPTLEPLPAMFAGQIKKANRLLMRHNARLLPGGMHPFFDPASQTHLWPHDYNVVYETYNRIFDCRGHGWSNLQSTHLNLPFADDAEFARLHAAVRLVLPLLPALSAASPVAEGRLQAEADFRLKCYATNSSRIPSATGKVIPEPVYSKDAYYREILQPIWDDTAPFDPDGNLQGEYANARGAIARFDRMAVEIRLLDNQECPAADVAICALIVETLKALIAGRWQPLERLSAFPVDPLAALFRQVLATAEQTPVDLPELMAAFGLSGKVTAGEVWRSLYEQLMPAGSALRAAWGPALDVILGKGTLSTRLRRALGATPARERITQVWRGLAHCLSHGKLFDDAAL
ncbi:MAG: glutamate--cysteine ligase [Planctomycetes bacterium]|nr:glutamate--cysteine ligase [Planctomycetota bacterium]